MTPDDLRVTLLKIGDGLDKDDEAAALNAWRSRKVSDRYPIVVLLLAAAGQRVSNRKAARILRCTPGKLSPSGSSNLERFEVDAELLKSAEDIVGFLLDGLTSDRTLADADREVEAMQANRAADHKALAESEAAIQELEHRQDTLLALARIAHDVNVAEHREQVRKTATVHDLPTKLTSIQESTDD